MIPTGFSAIRDQLGLLVGPSPRIETSVFSVLTPCLFVYRYLPDTY